MDKGVLWAKNESCLCADNQQSPEKAQASEEFEDDYSLQFDINRLQSQLVLLYLCGIRVVQTQFGKSASDLLFAVIDRFLHDFIDMEEELLPSGPLALILEERELVLVSHLRYQIFVDFLSLLHFKPADALELSNLLSFEVLIRNLFKQDVEEFPVIAISMLCFQGLAYTYLLMIFNQSSPVCSPHSFSITQQ